MLASDIRPADRAANARCRRAHAIAVTIGAAAMLHPREARVAAIPALIRMEQQIFGSLAKPLNSGCLCGNGRRNAEQARHAWRDLKHMCARSDALWYVRPQRIENGSDTWGICHMAVGSRTALIEESTSYEIYFGKRQAAYGKGFAII